MNQLVNSIFGRMYIFSQSGLFNRTISLNNISQYFEQYQLSQNVKATTTFQKTNINKLWTIQSHIILEDTVNKINYFEKYQCEKINNKYVENHYINKINILDYCQIFQPITFNDLPKDIKQMIYLKSDKNIMYYDYK